MSPGGTIRLVWNLPWRRSASRNSANQSLHSPPDHAYQETNKDPNPTHSAPADSSDDPSIGPPGFSEGLHLGFGENHPLSNGGIPPFGIPEDRSPPGHNRGETVVEQPDLNGTIVATLKEGINDLEEISVEGQEGQAIQQDAIQDLEAAISTYRAEIFAEEERAFDHLHEAHTSIRELRNYVSETEYQYLDSASGHVLLASNGTARVATMEAQETVEKFDSEVESPGQAQRLESSLGNSVDALETESPSSATIVHHRNAWRHADGALDILEENVEPALNISANQAVEDDETVTLSIDLKLTDVRQYDYEDVSIFVDGEPREPVALDPEPMAYGSAHTNAEVAIESDEATIEARTVSKTDAERNATDSLNVSLDEIEVIPKRPDPDTRANVTVEDESGATLEVTGYGIHPSDFVIEHQPLEETDEMVSPVLDIGNKTPFESAELTIPIEDTAVDEDLSVLRMSKTENGSDWEFLEPAIDAKNATATVEVEEFSTLSVTPDEDKVSDHISGETWPVLDPFWNLEGWSAQGDVSVSSGYASLESEEPADLPPGSGDPGDGPQAVITGPTSVYEGSQSYWYADSSTGEDLTYSWSGDVSGTGSVVSGIFWDVGATKTVSLTVTDSDGNTDSTSQQVEVLCADFCPMNNPLLSQTSETQSTESTQTSASLSRELMVDESADDVEMNTRVEADSSNYGSTKISVSDESGQQVVLYEDGEPLSPIEDRSTGSEDEFTADVSGLDGEELTVTFEAHDGASMTVDYVSVLQDSAGSGISDAIETMDLEMLLPDQTEGTVSWENPTGDLEATYSPLRLDPEFADTSGDGMLDGNAVDIERTYEGDGTDVQLNASVESATAHPARSDTTGNGMNDYAENRWWDTNPMYLDTSGDGLHDMYSPDPTEVRTPPEVKYHTEQAISDTEAVAGVVLSFDDDKLNIQVRPTGDAEGVDTLKYEEHIDPGLISYIPGYEEGSETYYPELEEDSDGWYTAEVEWGENDITPEYIEIVATDDQGDELSFQHNVEEEEVEVNAAVAAGALAAAPGYTITNPTTTAAVFNPGGAALVGGGLMVGGLSYHLYSQTTGTAEGYQAQTYSEQGPMPKTAKQAAETVSIGAETISAPVGLYAVHQGYERGFGQEYAEEVAGATVEELGDIEDINKIVEEGDQVVQIIGEELATKILIGVTAGSMAVVKAGEEITATDVVEQTCGLLEELIINEENDRSNQTVGDYDGDLEELLDSTAHVREYDEERRYYVTEDDGDYSIVETDLEYGAEDGVEDLLDILEAEFEDDYEALAHIDDKENNRDPGKDEPCV